MHLDKTLAFFFFFFNFLFHFLLSVFFFHAVLFLFYLFRKYQITKAQHISGGSDLRDAKRSNKAKGHNYSLWRAISII